ncbi:hypothetical protein VOLCADRAFT_97070 [Volvox carteri f. nagariensis]|uniref:Glycosyl transferase CAP10 domain-containing protein n=1 Tax=Volvox carteri f. nagariensis TaxID=3068 RepID=D8UBT8_VOLCA|nr:uncharacterized protein VOLCADRAFT_97070 [Volvox carteri f. nagariensis]EFJ42824.1 hypothetical protein VOLCADRAFT_97070 [Volvox carteri f. nagariensis]|eukprot:XP_002956084.1 hypothetical protein VOLCADRAFT_97070 [Volvox carteri f. nagariensis]
MQLLIALQSSCLVALGSGFWIPSQQTSLRVLYAFLGWGRNNLNTALPQLLAASANLSCAQTERAYNPDLEGNRWDGGSDNLEADLAPWRGRAPLSAADIPGAYMTVLQTMNIPAVIQLALIYNNRLYWPNRPDPNGGEPTRLWASYFVIHFHRRLTAALASGRLVLPNALFIYNTDDNAPRFNAPGRKLPVPLLSLIKSQGLEGGDDLDILVPQMYMVQSSMFFVPWHLKTDRAFFRGMPFCNSVWRSRYGVLDACARLYLSHLSYQGLLAGGNDTTLDCGLAEPFKHRLDSPNTFLKYDLPVLGRVPFPDHAHYKWLLNLEGITASSRLGQLFHINSLVISQRSPYLEYFYRSLRPWEHYVLFWNATAPNGTQLGMDDVYSTIEELRRLDREQPWKIQEVISAANSFAVRFLQPHTRLWYYQEAITRYKSLFRDMDNFLESFVQALRQKGWLIP